MSTIPESAALHARTVTEVSEGRHLPKRRRRPASGRSSRPVVTRVDPRVMDAARQIVARGSYSRVQILSPEEVIVR